MSHSQNEIISLFCKLRSIVNKKFRFFDALLKVFGMSEKYCSLRYCGVSLPAILCFGSYLGLWEQILHFAQNVKQLMSGVTPQFLKEPKIFILLIPL